MISLGTHELSQPANCHKTYVAMTLLHLICGKGHREPKLVNSSYDLDEDLQTWFTRAIYDGKTMGPNTQYQGKVSSSSI